jgi:hypothetical protein
MRSSLLVPQKRLRAPDLVLPAGAAYSRPHAGHRLMPLRSLGIMPGIAGGAGPRGIANEGDLIDENSLPSNVDLNQVWRDYIESLNIFNAQRNRIVSLLTFPLTDSTDSVIQSVGGDFEKASEYGLPTKIGTAGTISSFSVGFGFDWWDAGAGYTWRFLIDAPQSQIDAIHNAIMEADNRLVFHEVMKTVFNGNNVNAQIHGNPFTVYKFYNADGTVPPAWKTFTHTGTHTHYLTSGAATLDPTDVDDMYEHLRHHGYGSAESGTRVVLFVNPAQGDTIKLWRTPLNGGTATYDAVTPTDEGLRGFSFFQPTDTVETRLVGGRPPSQYQGLDVSCSYGPMLVIKDDYIPVGYMFMFATGGDEALPNPIGFREHQQAALRGLKLVKGQNPDYPLQDAFYRRGFGTGVRHRGAGVVMQLSANASYTIPAEYVT